MTTQCMPRSLNQLTGRTSEARICITCSIPVILRAGAGYAGCGKSGTIVVLSPPRRAKNLSWFFVLNQERFFASRRMTAKRFFLVIFGRSGLFSKANFFDQRTSNVSDGDVSFLNALRVPRGYVQQQIDFVGERTACFAGQATRRAPRRAPASTPRTTFGLVPLVEMATRMSPRSTRDSICREKICSKP